MNHVINFVFFAPFAGLVKTSLMSGSSFNVTWHLAYPHRVSVPTAYIYSHTCIPNITIIIRSKITRPHTRLPIGDGPCEYIKITSPRLCNREDHRTTILFIPIANIVRITHDPVACPVV